MIDLNVNGYYIIRPEHASWADVEFHATSEEVPYETMTEAVGGYIELVVLANGGWAVDPELRQFEPVGEIADAYVNEEGKLEDLAYNALATELTRAKSLLEHSDYCAGAMIVICGEAREKPEEDLDDEDEEG